MNFLLLFLAFISTADATTCADGWESPSTGRGTCSHHGGIARTPNSQSEDYCNGKIHSCQEAIDVHLYLLKNYEAYYRQLGSEGLSEVMEVARAEVRYHCKP